jgi:hypothetical protein
LTYDALQGNGGKRQIATTVAKQGLKELALKRNRSADRGWVNNIHVSNDGIWMPLFPLKIEILPLPFRYEYQDGKVYAERKV